MFLLYFKDNKKRDDMIMIIEKLLLYWILSCLKILFFIMLFSCLYYIVIDIDIFAIFLNIF